MTRRIRIIAILTAAAAIAAPATASAKPADLSKRTAVSDARSLLSDDVVAESLFQRELSEREVASGLIGTRNDENVVSADGHFWRGQGRCKRVNGHAFDCPTIWRGFDSNGDLARVIVATIRVRSFSWGRTATVDVVTDPAPAPTS